MFKFFFVMLTLSLLPFTSECQYYNQTSKYLKANSNWILGNWGVNMNTNPPTVFPVPYFGIDTMLGDAYFGTDSIPNFFEDGLGWNENSSQINVSAPNTGQLLFNIKNNSCYDKNFQLMPNGYFELPLDDSSKGWWWWEFSDYYNLVTPSIVDVSQYFYFRPINDEEKGELRYSVIDMNLNNGLGDIPQGQKNLLLWSGGDSLFINKIIATPGNNCDIWLIMDAFRPGYKPDSSKHKLVVFNINNNGIMLQPQILEFNSQPNNYQSQTFAELLFSPDRRFLYLYNWNNLLIMPFDAETGNLSKPILNQLYGIYGNYSSFVFSNDNKYLIGCNILIDGNYSEECFFEFYEITDTGITRHSDIRNPIGNFQPDISLFGPDQLPIVKWANMKAYGDKIYVTTPRNLVLPPPPPIGGRSFVIHDNYHANSALTPVSALNGQDWSQFQYGPEITLPPLCGIALPKEVVQPIDTVVGFGKEIILCGTDSAALAGKTLEAKPGFTDYVWNDGTTGSNRHITIPGKYWVKYKAPCNIRIDTFLVSWRQVESVLPDDTVICNQRLPYQLKAGQADNYLWSDNSSNQNIEINTAGVYWLKYEKEQCLITDSIKITIKDCPCSVNVPNVFSPNGDGLNDFFKPVIGLGCVPSGYTLKIFNRFGQIVYSSFNEFDKGWDGTHNGTNADGGSYYYFLTFKSKYYDGTYSKKGDFILIR